MTNTTVTRNKTFNAWGLMQSEEFTSACSGENYNLTNFRLQAKRPKPRATSAKVPGSGTAVGMVIVFASRVTAPFRANALPSSLAPVASEMDVKASILPSTTEVVPRVAELPTCQKMLAASAPPASRT